MVFDKAYFDAGVKRTGTNSYKWDGMIATHGDADMVPMWVADMDFPSPPAVKEALRKVLEQDTWGYTMNGEQDAKALCGFWARRHGVTITPEDVIMSPCVVTGLRVATRVLTKPGEGVLVNPPVYGPFYTAPQLNGRKLVLSPLHQDENGVWQMDFEDVRSKLASGEAKAIILCSPHNPCGRVWSADELKTIVDMCREYGAKMIVDEIHSDFVFAPARHTSIMSVPGAEDIAVMLCAASKTFNVAGLQQSSIVCRNADIRKAIKDEMEAAGVTCGNAFALAATRACYTESDEWLDGMLAYVKANYDFTVDYIARHMPRIKVTPMDATYLMWLDCRALAIPQEELMKRIHAAHVKVNDGQMFGELGRGFIRLNIGCPRAQLERALENLKPVLA